MFCKMRTNAIRTGESLRQLNRGFSVAVIAEINLITLRYYAKQVQPLLLNFVHSAGIQFAIRRTVYDQSHLLGLEIQLLHQCRDSSRRLNAPAGAITDQNCHIHGGKQPPANMLHARFVIHHKIRVVCLQSLNLGLHQSIHKAIAALALGAAP